MSQITSKVCAKVDKSLKCIALLSYWMGILPKLDESKRNPIRPIVLCMILIACAVLVEINKDKGGFLAVGDNAFRTINHISSMSMFAVLIFTIWQFGYEKYHETQQLFHILQNFTTQIPAMPETRQYRFRFYIVGFFIGWLLSISAARYVWIKFDVEFNFVEVVIIDHILIAYIQVVILIIWYIWGILKRTYIEFNRMVDTIDITLYQADRLIVFHTNLTDSVALINEIFGGILFLVTLEGIAEILNCFYFLLITTDNSRENPVIYSLFLVWAFAITIQGVVVATMCEKVVDEGKKTITISYKALYRYSNIPAIREKLFILAHQATARCPQFSAAGFFNVDFAMLFTFVNLITTYVIVIIQFSGNKK